MKKFAINFAIIMSLPLVAVAESTPQSGLKITNNTEAADTLTFNTLAQSIAEHKTTLADSVQLFENISKHTPQLYPKMEVINGVTIFRAITAAEFSEFEVWLAAYSKNKNIKIEPKLNVYGLAYFYQGSYYNSINTYDKALAVMEKGLALQPTETALVTESGVSLIKLNKLQSALDLYNKLLAADGFVPRLGKARILRSKGYILTEQGKLDNAEQAYLESQKFEPDHAGAKAELAYIKHLKDGAKTAPSELTTYDKAKGVKPSNQ